MLPGDGDQCVPGGGSCRQEDPGSSLCPLTLPAGPGSAEAKKDLLVCDLAGVWTNRFSEDFLAISIEISIFWSSFRIKKHLIFKN